MPRVKRVLAATGLVGALAGLAMAVPAHAANVKSVCSFIGEVKVQDKDNPDLGMRVEGGKGTATFTSVLMICVLHEKNQFGGVRTMNAQASGTYTNLACGTNKFVATIDSIDDPKLKPILEGEKFAIETVGFSGPFYWHDYDKPPLPDTKDLGPLEPKSPDSKTWQAAGHAFLLPVPLEKPLLPPPPIGSCGKAFAFGVTMLIDHS